MIANLRRRGSAVYLELPAALFPALERKGTARVMVSGSRSIVYLGIMLHEERAPSVCLKCLERRLQELSATRESEGEG